MPTLHTPSSNGTEFQFDIDANESIVITSQSSGKHRYHIDAINDLYLWLKETKKGEWVYLGTKSEHETPNQGTVGEWARSSNNPRGGFYGITNGLRGRFPSFIPPILEAKNLVEIEHKAKNNRIRAL